MGNAPQGFNSPKRRNLPQGWIRSTCQRYFLAIHLAMVPFSRGEIQESSRDKICLSIRGVGFVGDVKLIELG